MSDCDWCEVRGTREGRRDRMPIFDEIVAFGVNIHIEQMDDKTYWMAIEKDGQRQLVIFESLNGRAHIVGRTDRDE